MKRFMIAILVCASVNIVACDTEIQERKQWQRQYMPLVKSGRNYKSQSATMFVLSLLCGPAVMIQPVMNPKDLMQLPTIEIDEIKIETDSKVSFKKIVTLKALSQQHIDINDALARIASNVKVTSRLLTLQDIGAVEDVHPVQKKLKPHQLKQQDVLKEQFRYCKVAKNPSQK